MSYSEQKLLQEIEQVQIDLRSISTRCAQRFDEVGDVADYACHIRDSNTYWARQQLCLEELERLEQAQMRHREGRYGLCESCGNQIEPARLQTIPYATRCAKCQRLISGQDRDNRRRSRRGCFIPNTDAQAEDRVETN